MIQKFGPCGVHPNAFCPAYGLAENTLVVSGRKSFLSEPLLVTVDADRLRQNGIVTIVNEKTIVGNDAQFQTLVGVGEPFCDIDGNKNFVEANFF